MHNMVSNYNEKLDEKLANLQSELSIWTQLFQKLLAEEFKIEDTGFEPCNSKTLRIIEYCFSNTMKNDHEAGHKEITYRLLPVMTVQ